MHMLTRVLKPSPFLLHRIHLLTWCPNPLSSLSQTHLHKYTCIHPHTHTCAALHTHTHVNLYTPTALHTHTLYAHIHTPCIHTYTCCHAIPPPPPPVYPHLLPCTQTHLNESPQLPWIMRWPCPSHGVSSQYYLDSKMKKVGAQSYNTTLLSPCREMCFLARTGR